MKYLVKKIKKNKKVTFDMKNKLKKKNERKGANKCNIK